jgi:ankyrin repeat protein
MIRTRATGSLGRSTVDRDDEWLAQAETHRHRDPADLHAALVQAADGYPAWARALIAAGADVNRDYADTTPLVRAVTSEYPAIVQALVDSGANVHKRDQRGRVPLDSIGHGSLRATAAEWSAIRRILVAAGADAEDRGVDDASLP